MDIRRIYLFKSILDNYRKVVDSMMKQSHANLNFIRTVSDDPSMLKEHIERLREIISNPPIVVVTGNFYYNLDYRMAQISNIAKEYNPESIVVGYSTGWSDEDNLKNVDFHIDPRGPSIDDIGVELYTRLRKSNIDLETYQLQRFLSLDFQSMTREQIIEEGKRPIDWASLVR